MVAVTLVLWLLLEGHVVLGIIADCGVPGPVLGAFCRLGKGGRRFRWPRAGAGLREREGTGNSHNKLGQNL